ncbi:MAG: hypothetical protein AAFN77_16295 [Planctomycetota bacterium]
MKTIGTILLWIGFLSGALATVYNPPSKAVVDLKGRYEVEQQRIANEKKVIAEGNAEAIAKLPPAPRYEIVELNDVELPDDGWNQIPWIWYGVSAAVCLAGVVVIQSNKQADKETADRSLNSIEDLKQNLRDAITHLDSVHKELETLPPSKVVIRIDSSISPFLNEFAEHRDRISSDYGLAVFADIMSDFAAGERAVNRAWSAAADGYFDEVDVCLTRADEMLGNALKQLEQAS